MYQRIVEFTRMFRERWSANASLSSALLLADAPSTADAAGNPTLGCVGGREGIRFLLTGECGLVTLGAGERRGR